MGLNKGSRRLFCVIVMLGMTGGRGAWPWPCTRRKAPPRKQSQARRNPARPWAVPSLRDVLQALVAPPHGRTSPRKAEIGQGVQWERSFFSSRRRGLPGLTPGCWRLWGRCLPQKHPLPHSQNTRPRAWAAEPCSVSAGTGGPGGIPRAQ